MKKFTKLLGIVLIMALVMSMGISAFADQTHSITIDNALEGETYTAYKIFDVTYSGTNGNPGSVPAAPAPDNTHQHTAYSYTITNTSDWWSVIIGTATPDANGKYTAQGLEFAPTSPTGTYVVTATNSLDAAEFAVLLNNNKTGKTSAGTGTGTKSGEVTSATINVNPDVAGYYFVDTTLGSLCSLDTTEPSATIREKNTTTTVDKSVQEDSSQAYGDKNDVDIGDTVTFKTEVTIGKHQKNVILHDTMTTSLDFNYDVSISGVAASVTVGEETFAPYTICYPEHTAGETTIASNMPTGDAFTNDTFAVTFDTRWTESLVEDTTVTLTYTAVLNSTAKIGANQGEKGEGNDNRTQVTYGDAQKTTEEWTRTYTWKVDVLKYMKESASSETKTPLKDAEFYFYNSDKSKVAKWETAQGGLFQGWEDSVKDSDGKETKGTKLITLEAGTLELKGLDADVYYLVETAAPAGYNMLKDPIKVEIKSNTNPATSQGDDNAHQADGTATVEQDGATTEKVEVLNQAGTELPSTGGIGTTIFYVVGSILVVAAGVLLITKKRMSREG